MKKYIHVMENRAGITDIELGVYYSLGGYNGFTMQTDPRGYYASVIPLVNRDGIIFAGAFSGAKQLVKPTQRKNQKAEAEAEKAAQEVLKELLDIIVTKNGLQLISAE